jgi:hypothetical protein
MRNEHRQLTRDGGRDPGSHGVEVGGASAVIDRETGCLFRTRFICADFLH